MQSGDGVQTFKIDRTIPTPFYYQLLQIIKQQIETGELKPGDTIPTEKELVESYSLSRATVRQAILQLVNDGYLRREKSKGTFVTKPLHKLRFMESLRGFSAEMERRGIPYYSRVLCKDVIPASDRIGNRLEISPGTQIFYMKRLRFVNDVPFLIDEHYIPYELCHGIEEKDLENISLYHTLEVEYGLNLHHGWREFEPIKPSSKEEIKLLEIYSNTNLLYVESVVCNKNGMPVDYFEAKIHGKFTVDIVNAEEIR